MEPNVFNNKLWQIRRIGIRKENNKNNNNNKTFKAGRGSSERFKKFTNKSSNNPRFLEFLTLQFKFIKIWILNEIYIYEYLV